MQTVGVYSQTQHSSIPALPTLYNACYLGPLPPTGVSSEVTGSGTVVVFWSPSFSGMCDVLAQDYTVRYRLSGDSGDYTTVNISGTTVTLRGLAFNAVYGVEVAAIDSNGIISAFSAMAQFAVTQTAVAAPSKLLLLPTVIMCFAVAHYQ